MNRRKPIRHGTPGGYRAHYRHGEPMCEPCRDAERSRKGYLRPLTPARCGTDSGYSRHRKHGEQPCQPCRDAHAAHQRAYMKPYRRRKRAERELLASLGLPR